MNDKVEPQILKITPFSKDGEGSGVAAVSIGYGPFRIRAKLYKNDNGYFLGMPGRKLDDDRGYFKYADIFDPTMKQQLEQAAIEAFEKLGRQLVAH
ncbi:MAG: hypothetical protein AB7S38_29460 [Vulcanimicrobiota bacterium]